MTAFCARLLRNKSGATSIEYAMIAVLVAVAIISGATSVGNAVKNSLTNTSNKVVAAGS